MMDGYKYTHLIFASDPGWVPPPGALEATDGLLRAWKLVSGPAAVYTVEAFRRMSKLSSIPAQAGHGVELSYSEAFPTAVVHNLFGRAVRQPGDEDAEIPDEWFDLESDPQDGSNHGMRVRKGKGDQPAEVQEISVVLGTDFREYIAFNAGVKIQKPPRDARGKDIAPYPYDPMKGPHGSSLALLGAFPAEADSRPPKCKIVVDLDEEVEGEDVDEDEEDSPSDSPFGALIQGSRECCGVSRAMIALEFWSEYPAFAETTNRMPNRAFIAALEKAWGCKVAEIGEFLE